MSLTESFEKTGNFLFKYRGHVPLIIFVFAIPVAFLTPYSTHRKFEYFVSLNTLFSVLFVLIGHIIRARTVGRRYLHTSGRNRSHQVANVLNVTGWYSIVRHPLYLGNAFIWLGISCFLENGWFVIILMLLFWLYYERIMFVEERFLESKFGDEFLFWSRKTPAFWPSFKNYKKASVPFSWKIVLKNEYPGMISTMSSFLFVIIIKRIATHSKIDLNMNEIYFALFIMVFGLVFKGIKKYTSLFEPMD